MATGKPVDLRIRRSKAAIRAAVASLMADRGPDDVSAKDVAATALINKKTFYAHYPSVKAVVDELESDAVREVVDVVRQASLTSVEGIAEGCLRLRDLAQDGATAFGSIIGTRMRPFLLERLREELSSQLMVSVGSSERLGSAVKDGAGYAVDFVAGGVVSLLDAWLSDGDGMSAEDVAESLAPALSPYTKIALAS
ncbi:TetR/AcrR family transcriptional regulator [Tractidigestivibacter sp.]|uniref:TetR/AcrR family transcriptional regulator n=1 Tax=Tractidigestivibacter sp. TaxID=2847320 RepID=UPI003D913D6D